MVRAAALSARQAEFSQSVSTINDPITHLMLDNLRSRASFTVLETDGTCRIDAGDELWQRWIAVAAWMITSVNSILRSGKRQKVLRLYL